ncbi:MAG: hypothetical protein KIT18_00050 [Burkholderiales bacterium]|nr:hypothetical protein [Burkholderiales bacterium]
MAKPKETTWSSISASSWKRAFTENGWVQSYGSRCVKPPIIYGDVWRPEAMTVDWTKYAQGLTEKRSGMLTGQ